jgi:hypothetical protein
MVRTVFASAFALAVMCGVAMPAAATPAATIEGCITDFRYQLSSGKTGLSGFGKMRDGRLFAFSFNATAFSVLQGTATSITPIVPGPGTGFAPAAEPELFRFLERAAADGAVVRLSLEASVGDSAQRVATVARAYPPTRC